MRLAMRSSWPRPRRCAAKIPPVNADPLMEAALNNAQWCDAVCRAHGLPTTFGSDAWVCQAPAPPLYPNLVTLSRAEAAQTGRIAELARSLGPHGWGVKDSFKSLDLVTQGFRTLFDGQWLRRPAFDDPHDGVKVKGSRVGSGAELASWEAAWRDAGMGPPGDPTARTFPPVLLDDPDIAFLSVTHGEDLAVGLIANRAAGTIGISNLFFGREPDWHGAARGLVEVSALWPGLPLVTYGSGPELTQLCGTLGFGVTGALRVWRYVGTEATQRHRPDS
jgi:hypothetical protein